MYAILWIVSHVLRENRSDLAWWPWDKYSSPHCLWGTDWLLNEGAGILLRWGIFSYLVYKCVLRLGLSKDTSSMYLIYVCILMDRTLHLLTIPLQRHALNLYFRTSWRYLLCCLWRPTFCSSVEAIGLLADLSPWSTQCFLEIWTVS